MSQPIPSCPAAPPPRGFRAYVAVLRSPGVLLPALGTALASVPIGMLGLAVLLLVDQRTGSVAAAGTVVAVLGVGTVLGMVGQGRLIDRIGPRRVLVVGSTVRVLASVAFVTVSGQAVPVVALAALAAVVGASEPQVNGALRALWPRLVEPGLRPAAAALSAVLFEIPVLAGPLVLAAVVAVAPVEVAVLAAAGFAVLGAWMFACSSAAARPSTARRSRGRGVLGPLAVPAVRRIVLVTAAQGFAVGVAQVVSAASAAAAGAPEQAGLLYAAITAGSVLGTAVYGSRCGSTSSPRLVPALLAGLAATLAVAAGLPGPVLLAVCLVVTGLLVGPLGVRCFVDLERHAPPGAPATAVTLLIAAGLLATSAGSAVAGRAVEAGGTAAALLIGAGCGLGVALTCCAGTARRPRRTPR